MHAQRGPFAPIVVSPPSALTLSRMPINPNEEGAADCASVMPTPLSPISMASVSPASRTDSDAEDARAWREMLVKASCAMRKISVAALPPILDSVKETSARQEMPVRRVNSETSHSRAAPRPRSSSIPGRSSEEMRCTVSMAWLARSTIPDAFCWSFEPASSPRFSSHRASIFKAVSTCPISSWISLATFFLSSSRADRRYTARLRSLDWVSVSSRPAR